MANLGSENTPIEGESFGLPSGYSFDEENGDLVIRDTDGTVAMRRAGGTWELESDLALNENDISGVGAFDSESVNTESIENEEGQKDRRYNEIASTEFIDEHPASLSIPSLSRGFEYIIEIECEVHDEDAGFDDILIRYDDDDGNNYDIVTNRADFIEEDDGFKIDRLTGESDTSAVLRVIRGENNDTTQVNPGGVESSAIEYLSTFVTSSTSMSSSIDVYRDTDTEGLTGSIALYETELNA